MTRGHLYDINPNKCWPFFRRDPTSLPQIEALFDSPKWVAFKNPCRNDDEIIVIWPWESRFFVPFVVLSTKINTRRASKDFRLVNFPVRTYQWVTFAWKTHILSRFRREQLEFSYVLLGYLCGGFKVFFFSPLWKWSNLTSIFFWDGLRPHLFHKISSCSIVFIPDSSPCLHRLGGFS